MKSHLLCGIDLRCCGGRPRQKQEGRTSWDMGPSCHLDHRFVFSLHVGLVYFFAMLAVPTWQQLAPDRETHILQAELLAMVAAYWTFPRSSSPAGQSTTGAITPEPSRRRRKEGPHASQAPTC